MMGKAELEVTVKNRKEETHTGSESMSVEGPDQEHAELPVRVKYAEGKTVNMGKFESARVDVSLEMPCSLNKQKIGVMLSWTKSWVKKALQEECDRLWEARD